MFTIDDGVLTATVSHLRACLPHEGVALWSGEPGRVTHWTPLRNVALRPDIRYAVDPGEWVAAWTACSAERRTPLALVHSHPTAPAVPSAADRAEWHYPDLTCVIVSFADGEVDWQLHRMS